MSMHQVKIKGKDVKDAMQRKGYIQSIADNLPTEALKVLSYLSKRPNAGKKLVEFQPIINQYI